MQHTYENYVISAFKQFKMWILDLAVQTKQRYIDFIPGKLENTA